MTLFDHQLTPLLVWYCSTGTCVLLLKQSQRTFTQSIGPRQLICHCCGQFLLLCSAVVTMLNQPASTKTAVEMHRVDLDTVFIWRRFCQSIWMPESSQFYFRAHHSVELENTAHRRSWDSLGNVHYHKPSIYKQENSIIKYSKRTFICKYIAN